MTESRMKQATRSGVIALVFGAGFLFGSLTQQRADAQLEDLGRQALEAAGASSGTVSSVMELGTAIVEMEEHVDGLQKNIDVLKKVKDSLGG
jgi:hypothetical protein